MLSVPSAAVPGQWQDCWENPAVPLAPKEAQPTN